MPNSSLSKIFNLDSSYSSFPNENKASFLKESKKYCDRNLLEFIKRDLRIRDFNDNYEDKKYTINKIEYIKNDIHNQSQYENTEEGWTLFTRDSCNILMKCNQNNQESSYRKSPLKSDVFDEKTLKETKRNLLDLLSADVFRVGFDSSSSIYFNKILEDNSDLAKKILLEIFYDQFDKEDIVYGILSILSILDYKKVIPEGPIIAMALTSYNSDTIKESLVRVFENWCNKDSLRLLEKIKFDDPWLDKYLLDVINDIKEYSR